MSKGHFLGFWFAYIETLTGLAAIFLILFVASSYRERILTETQEILIESWQKAEKELNKLGAAPIADPEMGGMRITIAENFIFPINQATLKKEGYDKIIDISKIFIELYKSNPAFIDYFRIKAGGHTDMIGGDQINFPLSFERAQNVSDVISNTFKKHSVPVKITPIAYGSKYPLKNHYSEWEPKNRRITLVLELNSTDLLSDKKKKLK